MMACAVAARSASIVAKAAASITTCRLAVRSKLPFSHSLSRKNVSRTMPVLILEARARPLAKTSAASTCKKSR
jgi:hypothetical protein